MSLVGGCYIKVRFGKESWEKLAGVVGIWLLRAHAP